MSAPPIQIRSLPGIRRDGTRFDGDYYTDGQWCRFQRGLPRKMFGYRSVYSSLLEKIYGINSYNENGVQYLYLGNADGLQQVQLTSTGALSTVFDRTPVGFAPDANHLWQFDFLPGSSGDPARVIAHAAPNLSDISSSSETPIYYGEAADSADLIPTATADQSGGIVVLGPYLLTFGNSGNVQIMDAGDPTTAVNQVWVTGSKFVRGMKLRGSGAGPSGILWSLDELVRATFNDDPAIVFSFDTLAETSIMSPQSVIEYDGIYYWAGVDRLLMFNGVVREIPNQMNINFFLDNLNFAQRQKVFAYKVPRFGEIWWCFPFGDSTECNHAIVFNVRENTWYDTALPGSGRSAGIFAKVYNKPFMVDVDLTDTGYTLWQHETGFDEIRGSNIEPIPSHFETADISVLKGQEPQNKALRVERVEPDFVQSGDLTLQVRGSANARAPANDGETFTFPENDGNLDASEQTVPLKENRRLMRFKIASNTPGGNYELGRMLGHIEPSDGRVTQ